MRKILSLFFSLTFVAFVVQAQNVVEPSTTSTSENQIQSQTIAPSLPVQESVKMEQSVNTQIQSNPKVNAEEAEIMTVQSNLSSHDKTNCNPANCKKKNMDCHKNKKMDCHGKHNTSAKDDAAGQTINNTGEVRQINSTPVDTKLQIANPEETKQVAAPLK